MKETQSNVASLYAHQFKFQFKNAGTDVYFETSEQHKSATNASILQDNEDIGKILLYLKQLLPFTEDGSLRNIAMGVIANEVLNNNMFLAFGKTIVDKMEGKDVFKCSLKRSNENICQS